MEQHLEEFIVLSSIAFTVFLVGSGRGNEAMMVARPEDGKVFPRWSTPVEIVILNGLWAVPSAKRFAAQQVRKRGALAAFRCIYTCIVARTVYSDHRKYYCGHLAAQA